MPQSYVSLHYHLVFATKGREPLLGPAVLDRLAPYVGAILKAHGCQVLAAGGMPDHTHWLVSLHPTVSVADALRVIKSCSSKWVNDTFPRRRGFAWQNGYAAFSVSASNLARVRAYVLNQAEHHRARTFQEEYLSFLRRHGITYDERYLWD